MRLVKGAFIHAKRLANGQDFRFDLRNTIFTSFIPARGLRTHLLPRPTLSIALTQTGLRAAATDLIVLSLIWIAVGLASMRS